jgi:hypothetical protein
MMDPYILLDSQEVSPMVAISLTPSALTLVIFCAVPPERQTELFQLNVSATEQKIKCFPGFLKGAFHQSLDGTSMAECIQWRSQEDFAAAQQNPDFSEHIPLVFAMAQVDFAQYEVMYGMSRRQGKHASPTIEADRTVATIIARYTVEAQDQLALVHLLQQHHEQALQSAPGWLSTSVLQATNGTRVLVYLQVKKTGDDTAAALAHSLETVCPPFAASDVQVYTVDWLSTAPHLSKHSA